MPALDEEPITDPDAPGVPDTDDGSETKKLPKSKEPKADKKAKKAGKKAAKEGEKAAKDAERAEMKAKKKKERAARRKQLLEYLAFFLMGGGAVLGLAYGQFSWGSEYRDHMGLWALRGFLVGSVIWIAITAGAIVNGWRKELKEDIEG